MLLSDSRLLGRAAVRRALGAIRLGSRLRLAAMFMLTASLFATAELSAAPADDLAQAVKAGGSPSVTAAEPEAFMRAFVAVAARVRARELPAYAAAAVTLRPDLAEEIVVAALTTARLKNSGHN